MVARIHRNRRIILGLLAVLVLVAAGTTAAGALSAGGGARYRTATAVMGSVDQELSGVGTVSAVNRISLTFPVSGTIASIPVTVGTKVSAGEVLAQLSPTELDQAVNTAEANLASAQQTLASDQASQTESTATESAQVITNDAESADSAGTIVLTASVAPRPSGNAPGDNAPGGTAPASGNLNQLIAQITAGQQAVVAAQQKLDQDLAAAESALATCQNALSSGTSGAPPAIPTASSPTATSTSASASATVSAAASTPAAGAGDATCLAAIKAAPSQADADQDEQARGAAEQKLDAAVNALEAAAKKAASSSGKSSAGASSGAGRSTGTGSGASKSSPRSSGGGSSTGGNSAGSGFSSGGSRTSTGPASAAQVAADQAQIDAAQAQLVVAQQNRKAAVLTSPLDGTVAAVSMTVGKSAGSASSITVIGTGQSQVSTTVGLADIDKVKVGDQASIKVDGISANLTGKVSLIGLMNTTSGSSTAYPVTILLDPTSQKLYDGSGAATQIRIASVDNVLTVPSSAVRSIGQLDTVSVLTNGKPVTARVTIGAVGTDRTQILSGLKAGQQVVLANLAEKLPTSSS